MNAALPVETLVTDHLDLWTTALKRKSTAGRGSSSKVELYGIKKLRELILELAVRGLLVQQDPNDEPASELLEKIAAEKARLLKDGKGKKEKPLPSVNIEHVPFAIPDSWRWCWLGEIQHFTNGFAIKSTDLHGGPGVGVIKIGDVYRGKGVLEDKMQYVDDSVANSIESKFMVNPGDMVITMTGDVKVGFNNTSNTYVLNQRVGKIECLLAEKKYIYLQLVNVAQSKIEEASGGVIPNVSTGEINATLVPLPPLAEQHRIVNKVDELMALCDQLEQQTDASLGAHQTLVETLLSALTSAADHVQFASAWQRIASHFDTLFTTEESIAQLKQTILQLAVMGKLVPQDPNDEPASELLKKIAAKKAKLVEEDKTKKDKPLPPIRDDERPFDLPGSWEIRRLGDIAMIFSGNAFKSEDFNEVGGTKVIKITNAGVDEFIETADFLPQKFPAEYPQHQVFEGDLILALTRPYVSDGLKISLCPASYHGALLNQRVAAIRCCLNNAFVYLFLKSGFVLNLYKKRFGNSGLQPNLKIGDVTELVIPLPPLAEQHRIVAKVDELMALCDQLKSRLSDAQTTQFHLADALVERAIG